VEGAIELHNIYLGPDNLYRAQRRSSRLTTTGYHSDVSYEHQPPGITILTLLSVPATGGDTGWVSQVAAYERLSEPIKQLLEGLRAEHSGFPQAEGARRDGKFVRREPVKSEHPIVRVHPVSNNHPFISSNKLTTIRQLAKRPSSLTPASQNESSD
jgi:sulfonate dioxygenase